MTAIIVEAVVRHLLGAAGAGAAAAGYLSGDQVQAGIGALVTLGGIVWSVVQKLRA